MNAPRFFCHSFLAAVCKMARSIAVPSLVLGAVLLQIAGTVASASTLHRTGVIAHPFALGASVTQNNVTITQNFSSVYYVDTKTSPFPTGFYAAYNITNNSS